MLTEFQLKKIRSDQEPLSFVPIVEAKTENLTDCGYGVIEDSVMKIRICKGLTGRQTF